MFYGLESGGLEVRKRASGAMSLAGRFPYNKAAVLSDGGKTGRPRKEVIASRAFAYRVERESEDIHLLVGHSYDRPLASRGAGSLKLRDTDDALEFEADLSPAMQDVSYVRDFMAGFQAGLIMGLSPGFRIPPERVAPNAESVADEDPALGMAIIRTINEALLYELSIVTRPAYSEAQVEARNWQASPSGVLTPKYVGVQRWR